MAKKEKLIEGLNFKKEEYLKLLEKHERLKQRFDTLYTAYGLFLDYLEHSDKTKIENVDDFIIASKADLKEEDLAELRNIRNLVTNYDHNISTVVETVFPKGKWID